MSMYAGKNILVAGGTGTIGIQVVKLLLKKGANVAVASLDSDEYARRVLDRSVEFKRLDLTLTENCLKATKNKDFVFNLVGIKGSVGIGETKVASYFVPMLRFQTNLMDAAFHSGVERYMFISSTCIYPQSAEHFEENAWNGMPKQNDRIPGLAKRIGEIQGEAYLKEHGWDAVRILRPSNVFGPFDDFNPQTAQVIPALISRVLSGENPLKVWGSGGTIRDFIYSKEIAHWILEALIKAPPCEPINLGSGRGYSIKELIETIRSASALDFDVTWGGGDENCDPIRLLNMNKAKQLLNFEPVYSLEEGVRETIEWIQSNPELAQLKGFPHDLQS